MAGSGVHVSRIASITLVLEALFGSRLDRKHVWKSAEYAMLCEMESGDCWIEFTDVRT